MVRNWLRSKGELVDWIHRAVGRLEEVFPDHNHSNRATWRRYTPHARHILESGLVASDHPSSIDLK
jgi:hypothetical protein